MKKSIGLVILGIITFIFTSNSFAEKVSGKIEGVVSNILTFPIVSGMSPREVKRLVEECMKYNVDIEGIQRIIMAVSEAYENDVSFHQMRIFIKGCLKRKVGVGGIEAALRTMRHIVERGLSSEVARDRVITCVLSSLRQNLKGEELVRDIEKRTKVLETAIGIKSDVERKRHISKEEMKEWIEDWQEESIGGPGPVREDPPDVGPGDGRPPKEDGEDDEEDD